MNRLFLVLALGLFGCDPNPTAPTSAINESFDIRTVTHDGHKWVVAYPGMSRGGASIVHHPDCGCGKGSKVEK